MRLAICDDRPEDSKLVAALVEDWTSARGISAQYEMFPSAEALLFRIEETHFDILLLDIEMGGMDGVTLAKRVREGDRSVQIVFVTGYTDYIAEGYDVAALHYLVKPVSRDKFFTVLDRAVEKMKQSSRVLDLSIGGEMVRVPLDELKYLEVIKNYVTLHASVDYTVKSALKDFEDKLDGRFFRIGRGVILNLERIRRVTKQEVTLNSGDRIPLPRGMYEPLNRAIIARD